MRCIACNSVFEGFKRTLDLEDGTSITIDEDMCWECRSKALDININEEDLDEFLKILEEFDDGTFS